MKGLQFNPDDSKLNEELARLYVHERNFTQAYKYFLRAKLFAKNEQELNKQIQQIKGKESKELLFEEFEKNFMHSNDLSAMTSMPGEIYAQIQIEFLFEKDI